MRIPCFRLGLTFVLATGVFAQACQPKRETDRNVALASFGTTVRADSEWTSSPFAKGGEGASHLIDGIRNEASSNPAFNRWHSAPKSPHPHWSWLRFPAPCAIRRVVLWRTTLSDYPVEFKISYLSADRSRLIDIVHVREDAFPAGRMDLALPFFPVITDNLRLVILRSSNKDFPGYTQLSELEVIGTPLEMETSGKPLVPLAGFDHENAPIPPPLTEPADLPAGLRVDDRADRVTFESPSQRLTLSKLSPRILDWRVDGFGEGRFRKNILTPYGVAPCFIGPQRDTCRALPSVPYSRRGNVVSYGELSKDGFRTQWVVTVHADGFTIVSTEERTRPIFAPDVTDTPRVRFDFDAGATPSSPLGRLEAPGLLRFPVFLTVPDFGAYLVTARASSAPVFWKFGADLAHRRLSLDEGQARNAEGVIVLPPSTNVVTFDLRVRETYPLARCMENDERFRGLRRAWTNIFQFRPDIGILSNNVVSQNCIFCLYEYADAALYTPELPGGLSAMDLVRDSLDAYLDGADGYGRPSEGFLDSEPSLLIAAWDYYVATGDRDWLSRRLPDLEVIGDRVLARDKDRDGLVESFLSGNSNSFHWASNWWDVITFGHKDAYANALTYRALTGLADLEKALGRGARASVFSAAALGIRKAFAATFYDPGSGVLAGWKSADGQLHDYHFTFIAGIAITYGLVPDKLANSIVDCMQAKFRDVGFRSFQYGLPGNLAPIAKKDYVPGQAGAPQRDDGSDTFQQYENGAASGNFAYFYIQALYKLGRRDEADRILFQMLEAYDRGTFQGGVGSGVDWKTWDGKACGYEGMLVDNYYPLLAVLTGYLGLEHDMAGVRLRSGSPLAGRKVDWNFRHLGRPVTLPSSSGPRKDCFPKPPRKG